MLNHLETEICKVTRLQLDKLAAQCPYSKNFVKPGSKKYLLNGQRDRHYPKIVVRRHGKSEIYGCNKCNVKYQNYTFMQHHLRLTLHHPLVYQCAGCNAQFADLSALLQHVESNSCEEGLSKGTGSIAQLLHYLWMNIGAWTKADRARKDFVKLLEA